MGYDLTMEADELERIKRAPKQDIEEGVGAKYHRTYSIVFRASEQSAFQAMAVLQANPNLCSPQVLAKFEKLDGIPNRLQKNDHFQIFISGPWNGPVRVDNVNEHSFTFVTLQGHMEAGKITFAISRVDENHFRFSIESYARSKDYLIDLFYDKIPLAKKAQTEMWKSFCHAFAETALKNQNIQESDFSNYYSEIEITTERCDEETGQWEKI